MASLPLRTEALVSEVPEKDKPAAMPHDHSMEDY